MFVDPIRVPLSYWAYKIDDRGELAIDGAISYFYLADDRGELAIVSKINFKIKID